MRASSALLKEYSDFQGFFSVEGLPSKHEAVRTRPTDPSTIVLNPAGFATVRSVVVPLFEIKSASWRYVLRQPLSVQITQEGESFVAEHPKLEIIACGADQREAIQNFRREFDVIYYEIGQADPATLMPRARQLRELLRSLVVSGP